MQDQDESYNEKTQLNHVTSVSQFDNADDSRNLLDASSQNLLNPSSIIESSQLVTLDPTQHRNAQH